MLPQGGEKSLGIRDQGGMYWRMWREEPEVVVISNIKEKVQVARSFQSGFGPIWELAFLIFYILNNLHDTGSLIIALVFRYSIHLLPFPLPAPREGHRKLTPMILVLSQ